VSKEAIAEALTAFARRRSEAEAAAGLLRNFVLREHDVDRNADRLVELYDL